VLPGGQLTDEERVYLNAAALGDLPIVRQSLSDTNDVSLNVNCLDYMGRSALHLAVDSESMEAVELLLDRVNFECIEESLLHAISKGATKIVKVRVYKNKLQTYVMRFDSPHAIIIVAMSNNIALLARLERT